MTGLILRPSAAHRWANCEGSLSLEAKYPEDEESPAAREGTAAHFYATEALQGRIWPEGHLTPNGHPIDRDMIEGGQLLIDDVRAAMTPDSRLYVETPVTMHALIHPRNQGTPDVILVDMAAKRIRCWDFKYGHRYVNEFENWQGIDYLAGAVEGIGLTAAELADGWMLDFTIVQPRYFRAAPVRTWTVTGAQFWGHIATLQYRASLTDTPTPSYRTGEHCRDCQGRHDCPALQLAGGVAMDLATHSLPVTASVDTMAREARLIEIALDRLNARQTGLKEQLIAAARAGQAVPYWSMERDGGTLKWTRDAEEVYFLGDMLGVDLRKPLAPLTPTQSKTVFKKAGIDEAVINDYAQRIPGEAKLKLLSDSAVKKAFG